MGTDEEALVKLGTTFVIQTEPPSLHVDLWCNYVNMGFGFTDNLQAKSLE